MRNLAARAAMMGGSGGVLPYDAEVEYLESVTDGDAYINTGRYDIFNYTIESEFVLLSSGHTTKNIVVAGARQSAGVNEVGIWASDNGVGSLITRDRKNQSQGIQSVGNLIRTYQNLTYLIEINFHTHLYDLYQNNILLNPGWEYQNGNCDSSYLPITLFKLNGTTWGLGGLRMYYFKSGSVFDAIPVRVGQVGYMYDRVSGSLFGSAGTGAFNIGPDVT